MQEHNWNTFSFYGKCVVIKYFHHLVLQCFWRNQCVTEIDDTNSIHKTIFPSCSVLISKQTSFQLKHAGYPWVNNAFAIVIRSNPEIIVYLGCKKLLGVQATWKTRLLLTGDYSNWKSGPDLFYYISFPFSFTKKCRKVMISRHTCL